MIELITFKIVEIGNFLIYCYYFFLGEGRFRQIQNGVLSTVWQWYLLVSSSARVSRVEEILLTPQKAMSDE